MLVPNYYERRDLPWFELLYIDTVFQSGLFYLWLWTLMIVRPLKTFSLSIHRIETFCIPRFVNGDMWSCFLLVYEHSICALCCVTMTHVHRKCMYSTSHWSGLTNLLSFLICQVTLCLSLLLSLSPTPYNIFIVRVYIFMWVVLFGGGTRLVLMENVIVCIINRTRTHREMLRRKR